MELNLSWLLQSRFARSFVVTILVLYVLFVQVSGQNWEHQCGARQGIVNPLMVGGKPAKITDYPWHAAVYWKIVKPHRYVCGGSIINRKTILSAAHCFFNHVDRLKADQLSIHVGRNNLSDPNGYVQKFNVSSVIIHPEFYPGSSYHDLALVAVSSSINWTEYVQPVCLWTMDEDQYRLFGSKGSVVGFGCSNSSQASDTLLEVNLTVVRDAECLMAERIYGQILTTQMFCAGGGSDVGPSSGDSGGGFVVEINGIFYVRGGVSFNSNRQPKMCANSKYTVFTDVYKYRAWIAQVITKRTWPKKLEECGYGFFYKPQLCDVGGLFEHSFLLLGQKKEITLLSFVKGKELRIVNTTDLLDLDFDCKAGRIYWTESGKQQILSAKYDGTDAKPILNEHDISPEGVAVDWISRRIYYVNRAQHTLEVTSLQNPAKRAVLFENFIFPAKIAIDPYRGKLFWLSVDQQGRKQLELSYLDGSEREILINRTTIADISEIRVSMVTGQFCYIERKVFYKINCVDPYNKGNTRSICSEDADPMKEYSDSLLFVWKETENSHSVSIFMDGDIPENFSSLRHGLVVKKTVTDVCPIFSSPCAIKNGNCPTDTICHLNPLAPQSKNCVKLASPFNELLRENK